MSDAPAVSLARDCSAPPAAMTPLVSASPRRSELDRLAGESPAMVAVREALSRIARADGSVLIQGPSGTGKELAARIVHELSRRSEGPFIPIDCGSLAEGVLESELFGHARGAFTSAAGERRGLFEEADGGTLFLDEIGNTSLAFQGKLLRVLEEREVRRLGANRARPVNVRVVAATNRDLASDARSGSFREDLLYRLDVLGLRMPALAERREDIALMAVHVLESIGSRTGEHFALAPTVVPVLLAHAWPGNVRELRNVLERASAFATRGIIEVEHLPERFRSVLPEQRSTKLEAYISACERSLIYQRLEANAWNRSRTAAELGITRRGLFNKIVRHDIRRAMSAG